MKNKLYYGWCGTQHEAYVVAENEGKAIQAVSDKLGINYLDFKVKEIEVDGYKIELVPVVPTGKKGGEVVEQNRGDGEEGEPNGGPKEVNKSSGGKSRAKQKSTK